MKRGIKIALIIIASLIIFLFLIRLINPKEIDDVTPEIPCPEIEKYNPDTLYIIPNYENNSISQNEEWCEYILSLNKTLELHGITHIYREFLYQNITQEELNLGISEFENCLNQSPEMFKPPQMKINEENKNLIEENNLKRKTGFSQTTHKVYHCGDTGIISNKIIKIF
jgi:predicted deacetylase